MTLEDVITPEERQELAANKAAAAAAKQQAEELERQLHQREEQYAISALVKESGPWAGSGKASAEAAAIKLASKQLKLENGGLLVTDYDGNPLVGQHGLMSASEFIAKFRQDHAYLTKQAHTPAPASDSATADANLKKLFASPAALNDLANRDIAEYRRVREIAISRGITK